jgi:hypothetical protein
MLKKCHPLLRWRANAKGNTTPTPQLDVVAPKLERAHEWRLIP